MVYRIAVNLVVIAVASCATAYAADDQDVAAQPMRAERVSTISPASALSLDSTPEAASLNALPAAEAPTRGAVLPSLYVSLAGLNAYDAFTTIRGVSQGAVESNAMMSGVARSPWTVVAVKSGATAGSILVAEKLWKSGHRGQAIGMMLATNAMMVFVGAHNSRVLGSQR